MSIALSALGVAGLLLSLSYWLQAARKRERALRLKGLELKPNCLLTRYPIVFLSGPRSLFRLFDHWNDVPMFLREHGYEVFVIEPVGRTSETRIASAHEALQAFGGPCHLIADSSLEAEVEALADLNLSNLKSLTVVRNPARVASGSSSSSVSIADLKPRRSAVEVFLINDESNESAKRSEHADSVFANETGISVDALEKAMGQSPRRLRQRILSFGSRMLLKLHNIAIRKKSKPVDALETAEAFVTEARLFKSEEPFLRLAVSLAERDLTQSI